MNERDRELAESFVHQHALNTPAVMGRMIHALSFLLAQARREGREEGLEEIARLRDRETDIAGMLQVADGGQYRADWEAPIRRLAEWRKSLQSLTPGGSEFQSPEACEAYVREKLRQGHEKAKEVVRLGREIARLRKAFRHTHVAGPEGDLDTCRECALDIRNPIHRREER